MKIIRKPVHILIALLILGGVVSQGTALNLAPVQDLSPPAPTPRGPQELPAETVPENGESIDPQAQPILQEIARIEGIPVERLLLGYFDQWELPLTERSFSYAKVVDRLTGQGYALGMDDAGRFVDPMALRQAENQAYNFTFGKLHPALFNHLTGVEAQEMIRVSIWLDMGGRDASIERLDANTLQRMSEQEITQFRSAGIARAAQVHHEVEQPLIDLLPSIGARLIDAADTAPIVFAEVPAQAIQQLAALSYVQMIDLLVEGGPDQDGGAEKSGGGIEMATASLASKSDIVEHRGFNGAGIVSAVVEGDSIEFANPYLADGTCGPTASCPTIDEHATAVGGILASTHSTARGTAPGVGINLLSANGDGWFLFNHQTATTWALNAGADVLNNSYYLETDGVMHVSDRWMDYIVRSLNVLEVKSAGNRGEGDAHVSSPGLGYNTLTVGAAEDKNTVTWDDDTMAELSSWDEPIGREKPEVSAIGCGDWVTGEGGVPGIVITGIAEPWIYDQSCGTSYSAPIVAGGGALLMDRNFSLMVWPEAVKAILIATALHNIEGNQRISEMDGAGAVDLAAADIVAANNWYNTFQLTPESFDPSYNLDVRIYHLYAGERVRVALAYDSNPSADYLTDVLEADLDLQLLNPSGTVVAASAGVDSWEIIDYTVPTEGDYTIRIKNNVGSLSGTEETYAAVAMWPGHYVLSSYQPQIRDMPPGGYYRDSGDDYRFTRGSYWNAVGLRSPSGGDYDIFLYRNSVYGDPADHALLEDSTTPFKVDFLVIDGNHAPTGNYYTTVSAYSGTGNYYTEHATRTDDLDDGTYGPYTMDANQVVRVWDTYGHPAVLRYYALRTASGDADFGMALYGSTSGVSSTYYQGRAQDLVSADTAGAGGAETLSYLPSMEDFYGLVVWNNAATLNSTFYIYVDSSPPTGSISINDGATYAPSTSVTLSLSAADAHTGVYQMRFSDDNSTWTAWEPYATSKAYTLPAGEGLTIVYVQFKNNAEMVSSSVADAILLDTTPPTGSISINSGASYASSTSVSLSLSASDPMSDVYQMRFSNDNTNWSTWEAYATSKAWTLPGGDGSKTVYVQYRNNAMLASVSYSDSITLDTTPPIGSLTINGGATYTNNASVSLNLPAVDATSGVTQMRFSNDNVSWSTWEAYAASKAYTLPGGDDTKTVYVQFKDNAGLTSGTYSDSIILDRIAPESSATSPEVTVNTSFALTWSGTDNLSGIAAYDIQYRVGAAGVWTDWLLGTTKTTAVFGSHLPVVVTQGETYYFRVRAHDLAGNVEEYPAYDTFTSVVDRQQIMLPLLLKLR